MSSRDLFSEATGVDIPPTVLMFIENDETFMISWARSDGYYEYWTLDVDDVDSDLGFINTVLAFTIMCDTYYSRVVYANANGDILQYYPEAVDEDVEDVEDYTYTTYDEFETAIFLSVLNAYIDEK